MSIVNRLNSRSRPGRILIIIGLSFVLASCGGGGGGGGGGSNGGNGSGGGGNGGAGTPTTYSVSLTQIVLEDTRNGRVFTAAKLPAFSEEITKN